MNHMRLAERLQEIADMMKNMQGMGLKSKMDALKKPEMPMDMEGKPKGLEVEKVSLMGKPEMEMDMKKGMGDEMPDNESDEDDMSDDEIQELLQMMMSK